MNLHMENAELALKPGQFLTLDDACGTEIRIENGSAWITEEGDSSDFTLAPGAAHTVMHQGRVLAEGAPAEIAANRAVQSAYLGESYEDETVVRDA